MNAFPNNAGTIAVPREQSGGWLKRAFPVVFALFYAAILAQLPIDIFKDRANYITYANYSDIIFLRYSAAGLFSLLANEPLWLLININLARFMYPENALRAIIFVPAFLVAWQLLKRNPQHAIWMVIFLLAPQVVKNHIIHLRQGLALSVFLLGYFARPKWLRFGLMLMAGFIHASFLFIWVIGTAVWASDALRLAPRLRAAILILCFIMIGALIGFVAGGFGARQAIVYENADLDISGIGFIFWAIIFLLFSSAGASFLRNNMFPFSVLAFYLAIYFITPVSGRIFESGMFLVFLSGLTLPHWRRHVFLWSFILLSAAQYMMRLDQPWLGWGI